MLTMTKLKCLLTVNLVAVVDFVLALTNLLLHIKVELGLAPGKYNGPLPSRCRNATVVLATFCFVLETRQIAL